jgi:hypothetical protein
MTIMKTIGNVRSLILLFGVLVSIELTPLSVWAQEDSTLATSDPVLTPTQQWVGAGTSLLVGFGVGHAVTDRFETVGYKFAIVDGVAAFAAGIGGMVVMGDCTAKGSSCGDPTLLRVGVATLLLSRLWQVADVLSYGRDHGMFGLRIAPETHGQGAVAVASFVF